MVGQSFAAYTVTGLENRIGATATPLPSGGVLVLGGTVDGIAVSSGVAIDTTQDPPTVTPLPTAMSAARVGHSATLLAGAVLVCGGADQNNRPVGSCDVIDLSTFTRSTVMMANARRGHSALALETGPIVIAGGFGDDGQPISSIEIYTP
jgi:hypothetical protein